MNAFDPDSQSPPPPNSALEPVDAPPRALESQLADNPILAKHADTFEPSQTSPAAKRPANGRLVRTPAVLFVITCLSVFWAGATQWSPGQFVVDLLLNGDAMSSRRTLYAHWDDGLIYMACLIGILLTHEMGHFIATLRHRVPASLPFFLPIPVTAIGTLGAVISMDGKQANRKEMYDIGIAGPLAGLVIAIPVMWIGVLKLDLTQPAYGGMAFDCPLLAQAMLNWVQPPGWAPGKLIWLSQLNPYFMAGWVGLLITGLNMLPISQLDGGHVIYTLFGKAAHWVARAFLFIAIGYIVFAEVYMWTLMVMIVMFIGADHPPTRDDTAPLGRFRIILGYASLAIPFLCFPPQGIHVFSG